VTEGGEISIHYDPMISKLITYGKDRTEALAHMRKALDSYVIRGLTHNVNFLRSLCDHPRFIEGRLTTNFIPEEYPQGYKGANLSKHDVQALVSSAVLVHAAMLRQQTSVEGKLRSFDAEAYVRRELSGLVVGFGAGAGDAQQFEVAVQQVKQLDDGSTELTLDLVNTSSGLAEKGLVVRSAYRRGDLVFDASVGGQKYTLQVLTSSDGSPRLSLSLAGSSFALEVRSPRQQALLHHMPVPQVRDTSKLVLSPMPGAVFGVKVKVGDEVAPGQEVVVVEAMKMQNALRAQVAGKVKAVLVKQGQTVVADQVLIEFE
jgi:propionyl-CoA carboxylase alpha chain